MNRSKWKLGTKLGAGFGAILVFLAAVGIIGCLLIYSLNGNVGSLGVRVNQMQELYEISKSFDDIAQATRNLCLTSDEAMNKKLEDQYKSGREKFKASLDKLEKLLTLARGKELFGKIREAAGPFYTLSDKAVALGKANKNEEAAQVIMSELMPVQGRFTATMDEFSDFAKKRAAEETEKAASAAALGITVIAGVGLLALALGTTGAWLITRSITAPLRRVITGLTDASGQVAAASSEVASSSQHLAEGTSEQAASLEETSSSLEEISSMTRQNADNSSQAKALMDEAKRIVEKVDGQMNVMTAAIAEVTKSSEETGKIIKTIDEIAFQTNLLALNAAVEAARAGEAGAGFAVVADEVRNLAMRAAEAAKNTSSLIENTIATVRRSSDLTQQTQGAFKENVLISAKIGNLIDEVEAASHEQAKGISQVSTAVAEMDKVVQSSAANAEQSASAAEQMNAQAEQMKGYVAELVAVVGGTGEHASAGESRTDDFPRPRQATRKPPVKAGRLALPAPAPAKKGSAKAPVRRPAPGHGPAKKSRPEDIIPMGDDDFKNF